jgi:hypothetical protein
MGYASELYHALCLSDEEYMKQQEEEEMYSYYDYLHVRVSDQERHGYEEYIESLRETIDDLLIENYDLSERLKTFIHLENPFLKSELFKKRWKQFQRDEPLTK